ncbi:uncharacterized protein LOC142235283 [Haematobia irritans]|uniref:uncharacterized protein LOC142235283 n=1 Tax=Haematobia irritans TaxID=7368 RepID=UPI003F5064E2
MARKDTNSQRLTCREKICISNSHNDRTNILSIDINIRIGEIQQDICDLYRDVFHAGTDIRKSLDKVTNTNGKRYIDYCNDQNLIVVNGQTHGDEEGNFTYVSNSGTSVNDICALSVNLLQYLDSFRVIDKIWSDHMPITLNINVKTRDASEDKLKLLPKLIWKDSYKAEYQSNLNNKLLYTHDITCIKELTDIVITAAPTRNGDLIFKPNKKWFNNRCYWARKKSFNLLAKFRKSSLDRDKQNYLNAKRKYKEVCETSKQMYYARLTQKLNETSNGKEWWKLVREINDQEFHISNCLSANTLKEHFRELLKPDLELINIHYAPALVTNNSLDQDITITEIKDMLMKTKPNKAPGEDRITYEYFANATDEFLTQLAKIYSKIYKENRIDSEFQRSVIFPIHKKGSLENPENYRGISFMNTVAKIFMGVLNQRLVKWVDEHSILVEHQAGFRKNYSTVDNIYNLSAIISAKLAEKRKVYAFFVDFKAAFDKISRNLLIYKLHHLGISYKFVSMIETLYRSTQSAVWNGEELSEFFETESGLKQGCLLSPLLFALYINDLNESLEGGINIEELNIRILLYADDIVVLAEDPATFLFMINNLEEYCKKWSLVVNTSKSKVMVFRNGGRLSLQEKWKFQGEDLEVVSEYKYLGVILTPQMKYKKHIQNRNSQAKSAINSTWKNFLKKDDISLQQKWSLYMAVCRSVQTYAAQVWGYGNFEDVDQLQRFFLKLVLRLPESTPNYALYIETELEEGHLYSLQLHTKYIYRTLFQYHSERLPHKLSKIIVAKKIFWMKNLLDLTSKFGAQQFVDNMTAREWSRNAQILINKMTLANREKSTQMALQSRSRFYKNLDLSRGRLYFNGEYNAWEITWIFKARLDLIFLNANSRSTSVGNTEQCTLCNLAERETIYHFVAVCPVLRGYRQQCFSKPILTEIELIRILNGTEVYDWRNLIKYITISLRYRKLIISEYA